MLMVVIMWPIAQKSNSDDSYEEAIEEAEKTDEAKEDKVRLGVKEILGPKRALFGFMSQIISQFVLGYALPTYSTHMVKAEPTCNAAVFGLIFATGAFTFAAQMPLSSYIIKNHSRRYVVYFGFLFMACACPIMGYDPGAVMIGTIGAKIAFTTLGMCLIGFGYGMVQLPIFPEILEAAELNAKAKGINYDEKDLQNNASGYFQAGIAIGWMLGPLTSS